MSDHKWQVTIEVDEYVIRSYYEQTVNDPNTTESDVRDCLRDLISDGGHTCGLWHSGGAIDEHGVQIISARKD